ncbi:hypothetical protein EV679_0331 [Kerstersia gyiorum]|uniref:Uncharacterized protein n=1 Tax=Kerstersia gyiorum TaxID=206506 RepID=A0A4Q7MWH3_9BURK|nr:hypothetical protein [Kerstersia gyiorum]KAB0544163.1 hypothetical protein F7P85_05980 [Kerstersia gyiorum]RZS73143.1 hypothetical protein EV679_0331 [Kerstersia gyiorum]
MSTAHLNVSTSTAHPYKPTVNQDAKEIADGVSSRIKQAVQQALLDAASVADAKIRRSLQGQFADEVLDALAGPALATLKQSGKQSADVAANSATYPHAHQAVTNTLSADISNLPKE